MADKQDEILTPLHGLQTILPTLATKADVGELRTEVGELRTKVESLDAKVDGLSTKVDNLGADVAAVQSGLDELRRVTSINHYKAIGRIDQVDIRLDRVIAQINGSQISH